MPPVGQMMSDQQIADVINYVRTHFGNAYGDAVSPADVEAARRQRSALKRRLSGAPARAVVKAFVLPEGM